MNPGPRRLAAAAKDYARELGFALVGITDARPFEQAERQVMDWMEHGHQGEMAWLNEARARLAARPADVLPGARSLLVVGASYRTVEPLSDGAAGAGPRARISRYAWGDDYHDAMRGRLRLLAAFLAKHATPPVESRPFVDSGPLLERDAAIRAGLGFRGKNTNLLTPLGSFVFLGALLTTAELEIDEPPAPKDCGSCRLCLDACPTDALATPYHLAADRCIAYLTIEHRGAVPEPMRRLTGEWLFGCDVCQDVCPHNRSARLHGSGWDIFQPRPSVGTAPQASDILALDDEGYRLRFKGSPLKRAKRAGLARNAALVLGNAGDPDALPALERASANDPDPDVRATAEWAIRRLAETDATGRGLRPTDPIRA